MFIQLWPSDVADVAPLIEEFYNEGALPGRFIVDEFLARWGALMAQGVATVVGKLHEDGVIAGVGLVVVPDICDGVLTAHESFMFCRREHRGGMLDPLLDAFEAEATRRGAERLIVSHLNNEHAEHLGRKYEGRGYRRTDFNYVRTLGG